MKKLLLLQFVLLVSTFSIAHADDQKAEVEAPVTEEKAKSWLDAQFYSDLVSKTGGLAKEDFEKMDDILYKVVTIKSEEISTLEERLNECGKDGWDLFNIHYSPNGNARLLLKKPAISYLEKVKSLR